MMDVMEKRMAEASSGVMRLYERSISSSVITGDNPTKFDATNPITLFIIQLFIIISFTQGLGWAFGFINQPKVIAEVVGGIVLGPTVMGRIPHFTSRIFPKESLSYLNLIATIGLILFLFLVGVEVDPGVMRRNGRNAGIISIVGMIVPFGLGSAVAVPIYNNLVDHSKVTFGHFLLFVGVAISITAFPVLCRILTSCKLLDTKVGVIVLAAGVGNDVVGWVLLALTLALVNSKAGVTAVYVLLCAVGWTLLLLFPIKRGFYWLARRSGSLDNGPTPGIMVLTLLIVFGSAFVTGIIGVHPIFGGFVAGLIIPHEGGFAIALVDKIDDLVTMLFLPIYFVLSGLNTNLSLLNTGKDWAYIILLCVIAFVGKFAGCAVAAKFLGHNYREAGAIGALMSCKGLVELIVLNVGLSAGILDQRLFSMFVVMAIVLTFITTPLTLWIYPARHRTGVDEANNRKSTQDPEQSGYIGGSGFNSGAGGREVVSRVLVVLQKIEHLSAVMFLTQMLEPASGRQSAVYPQAGATTEKHKLGSGGDISEESKRSSGIETEGTQGLSVTYRGGQMGGVPAVQIDALKLIELTGRTFSVMQSAEKDQLLLTDDALQLFRQFGRLRGIDVTPHISIVAQDSYPDSVAEYAGGLESEMVIVPWTIPVTSTSTSALFDPAGSSTEKDGLPTSLTWGTPFESVFGDATGSPMYTHFVRRVFSESPSDVALFIDRGFGSSAAFAPGGGQHVFLPFIGGSDDRLALRFVVQLCMRENVTASVVRVGRIDETEDGASEGSHEGDPKRRSGGMVTSESMMIHQNALMSNSLTVGRASSPMVETAGRIASETADDLAWAYYTSPTSRPSHLAQALSSITFKSVKTTHALQAVLDQAESSIQSSSHTKQWRPLMIVTGRGRKGDHVDVGNELNRVLVERGRDASVGAELRKTVGDLATGLMLGGEASSGASFLVVQAVGRK